MADDKWGFLPYATGYMSGLPKKFRIPGHWKRQREMMVVAMVAGLELGARMMRAEPALMGRILDDLGVDKDDVPALLGMLREREGEHGADSGGDGG